jgi:hypothetical protein
VLWELYNHPDRSSSKYLPLVDQVLLTSFIL